MKKPNHVCEKCVRMLMAVDDYLELGFQAGYQLAREEVRKFVS